jgi:predicted extracellular nuclease
MLIMLATGAAPVQSGPVISQIYGGGGNSGATYKNDFIEIFNASDMTINLTGDSVQYASSTGGTWQVTNLSGTLQSGQYYLIQEAAGPGGTTNLPTPDAIGTINMSATAGKVALVESTVALIGSAPMNSAILDLVGYGIGTNFFEGAGPAPTLSNTTSAQRLDGGLTDTNNNNLDFISGSPNPRNSASPFNPPMTSVPEPSAFSLCAMGLLGLLGFALLRRSLSALVSSSGSH